MTSYASAEAIMRAIERANAIGASTDGTYLIRPERQDTGGVVYVAERVTETNGYEVAYDSALGAPHLNIVNDGERWGLWTDGGVAYLDRTMYVTGVRAGVALDIARMYAQEAVWDWARSEVILTSDPATAL